MDPPFYKTLKRQLDDLEWNMLQTLAEQDPSGVLLQRALDLNAQLQRMTLPELLAYIDTRLTPPDAPGYTEARA